MTIKQLDARIKRCQEIINTKEVEVSACKAAINALKTLKRGQPMDIFGVPLSQQVNATPAPTATVAASGTFTSGNDQPND